jgi:HlyD family secretion protein
MQTKTFMMRIRAFFTKKVIWTIVVLAGIFLIWRVFFGGSSTNGNIQTGLVNRQNLEKTVLTTGQVVSSTDLDLSFQTSGVVKRVYVKEGDKVKAGQMLAVLDQSNASASLESARGSLAQAQANYNKIKAAATTADVAVTQASVDSAQTSLDNAKQNLQREFSLAYNSANTVVLSTTNNLFSNPQSPFPQFGIIGTVQTSQQLVNTVNSERVTVNASLLQWQQELNTVSDSTIDQVTTDSIATVATISNYLSDMLSLMSSYTQVTTGGSQTTVTADESSVASAKSTIDALSTSITTYSQAIKSAQSALDQAKASLVLKQSPARPEDVAIAEAQVLSASGQVHLAEATLSNTIVVAPADDTITQIDVKLGEQATAMKEAMKLQNVDQLHAEALVSEADIASVKVGQAIDSTFDALGPDRHFASTVLTVNPASTVISGVVNYKVTANLQNIPDIKPGMTANMVILVAHATSTLAVPSSAILNQNGRKYVRVIDDPVKKTYHQVEVQTGLEADAGLTQILSGVNEGQAVVTFIKQ